MPDLGGSIRRRRSRGDRGRRPSAKSVPEGIPAWRIGGGRRRRWRRKPATKPRRNPPRRSSGGGRTPRGTTLLRALGFVGAGLGTGYFVSTVYLFPAPAPPPGLQGVPNLRGVAVEQALVLLADSGLAGRVDSVRHPLAPAGLVIGQSPLPGRTALPGAEIRVTMSLGPEIRSVPDVTRLRGRAAAALKAGGFAVQVDTIESDMPEGRVVTIDPSPGTRVTMPGKVRLVVSLGPPTFPMPALSGFDEDAARSMLNALGLVLTTVEKRYSILNVNRVFGQYPAPHIDVRTGTAVRLVVGEDVFRSRLDPIGTASSAPVRGANRAGRGRPKAWRRRHGAVAT